MEFVIKILSAIVGPSLLVYIGWRGIKPGQRKGALRVILVMFATILAATAVYIVVMIDMTPKWVAKDCAAAYEEIAQSELAKEPTLAREPFLAGCNKLSMSAAECTRLSFAKKFPDSCGRYVDEIHAELPKLDLGIAPRAK
jgi:hypothetical protein